MQLPSYTVKQCNEIQRSSSISVQRSNLDNLNQIITEHNNVKYCVYRRRRLLLSASIKRDEMIDNFGDGVVCTYVNVRNVIDMLHMAYYKVDLNCIQFAHICERKLECEFLIKLHRLHKKQIFSYEWKGVIWI